MKLGSIPYLNARPLIEGLDGVLLDVPSRLTERFRRGEVDVALLPVFEAVRDPSLSIVPGISISSRGPVDSVVIFSRGPLTEVRELALDRSSLTSAALTRVLFAEHLRRDVRFVSCDPEIDPRESPAVLLIGDPAMTAPRDGLVVSDLALIWRRWTGLPFCFAAWVARTGELAEEAVGMLLRARKRGLAARPRIAAEAAAEMGLTGEYLLTYLTERITYDLGGEERAAIERFGASCRRVGLIGDCSPDRPVPCRPASGRGRRPSGRAPSGRT